EEYYSGRSLYAKLINLDNYSAAVEDIDLDNLREVLKKDLVNMHFEKAAFAELLMNYFMHGKETAVKEQGYALEIYEKLSDEDINYLDEIYLNDIFKNTLEYLK
ncbi:MAG: hypothetical protein KBA11_10570, partial [Sedimentibacter sp.]|nr:hypothetical protein [Sedimentibacter sp.]